RRRAELLRVVNRAEVKSARFPVVCINNCDAGIAQGSVNGENAHVSDRNQAREKRNRQCRRGDCLSRSAVFLLTPKWLQSRSRFETWLHRAQKLRADENSISLPLACARPRF